MGRSNRTGIEFIVSTDGVKMVAVIPKHLRNRIENAGTSMISKSQEETEVSWRLDEWCLEASVLRLS
jgi:hypothetical protein